MTTPGSLTWAVNRLLAVSNASPLRSVFLPQVCFASVGTACPPAYSVSYAGNQENVDFVTHSVQVHTQPVFFFFFFCHIVRLVGSYFPAQGSNPCPLPWKLGVLTTGLPGKSPHPWAFCLRPQPLLVPVTPLLSLSSSTGLIGPQIQQIIFSLQAFAQAVSSAQEIFLFFPPTSQFLQIFIPLLGLVKNI